MRLIKLLLRRLHRWLDSLRGHGFASCSSLLVAAALCFGVNCEIRAQETGALLPAGVEAVWDTGKAFHETTPTREKICLNGLWQWQPADAQSAPVPDGGWGYFKVPGCWPGISDYMQKD